MGQHGFRVCIDARGPPGRCRLLARLGRADHGPARPFIGVKRSRRLRARNEANGRVEMWRGGCRLNISVVRLFRLAVP